MSDDAERLNELARTVFTPAATIHAGADALRHAAKSGEVTLDFGTYGEHFREAAQALDRGLAAHPAEADGDLHPAVAGPLAEIRTLIDENPAVSFGDACCYFVAIDLLTPARRGRDAARRLAAGKEPLPPGKGVDLFPPPQVGWPPSGSGEKAKADEAPREEPAKPSETFAAQAEAVIERTAAAALGRGDDPEARFAIGMQSLLDRAREDLAARGFAPSPAAETMLALRRLPDLFDRAIEPALVERERVAAFEAVTTAKFAPTTPPRPDRFGRPLAESVVQIAERCFAAATKTLTTHLPPAEAGPDEDSAHEAAAGVRDALAVHLAVVRRRMAGDPFAAERAKFRREWEAAIREGEAHRSPPPQPAVVAADDAPLWVRQMRDARDRMREAARRAAVPPVPVVLIEDEPNAPGPPSPHPADCSALTRGGDRNATPYAWTRIDGDGELAVAPDGRPWTGMLRGGREVPGTDPPGWERTGTCVCRGVHAALPPHRDLAERHRERLLAKSDGVLGEMHARRVDPEMLHAEHRAAFAAVRSFVSLLDDAGRALFAAPAAVREATFKTIGPDLYEQVRSPRRLFLWAAFDLALAGADPACLSAVRCRAVGVDGGCGVEPEQFWEASRANVEKRLKADPALPYRWPGWFYVWLPDLFGACVAAADLLAEQNSRRTTAEDRGDSTGDTEDSAGDTGDTSKKTAKLPAAFDPWPDTDREFIKRMVAARPTEQRKYIRRELEKSGFNVADKDAFEKRVEALRRNYGRTRDRLKAAGLW
ncbi:hypothetical protein [Alienimonas sp. DA493]|uniref:hypothetical protein n=1 Tax=Alienimonas sp. DA493 TaxID=3373605 RepID=UPI003754B285